MTAITLPLDAVEALLRAVPVSAALSPEQRKALDLIRREVEAVKALAPPLGFPRDQH